ncbi:hypothetical protein DM02DRAFT_634769 [Periconia macrospinosa]|uniref:Uncharacterized protein n=1 Tax=Periconia macrospinosa TaxID=97972 RepID=A0A2V1D7G3_9PLEO|nr:hypothetical protein DM02DRAFT_634769 [Periconia macrospinosa]
MPPCMSPLFFLGSCALLGPSVYIGPYWKGFIITPPEASDLSFYPNLAIGFGRRPVTLGPMVLARIHSYQVELTLVHSSALDLSVPLKQQVAVNSVRWLDDRTHHTSGYSWQLFYYVAFAFAVALLILTFFVAEETAHKRDAAAPFKRPTAVTANPVVTANSAVNHVDCESPAQAMKMLGFHLPSQFNSHSQHLPIYLSGADRLAERLTRKNSGIREAEIDETRRPPPRRLNRIRRNCLVFFGVGMDRWGALFNLSFTLAYAVDS